MVLCELCKKREATKLTKFEKTIPSHIGARIEATMNLCDECGEKIKEKAHKFSTIQHIERFFPRKNNSKEDNEISD